MSFDRIRRWSGRHGTGTTRPPGGQPAAGAEHAGTAAEQADAARPSRNAHTSVFGDTAWLERMRALLWASPLERPTGEAADSEEESEAARLTARVLDLALRIGELMLASGQGAEDVEAAMLGVTRAYGLDRCEPQVTFTMISISYQASVVAAPATAARTVRRRNSDYTRLDAVHRLVGEITAGGVSVEETYARLATIRRNRQPYPPWVLSAAAGGLAASATLLVGGRWGTQALLVFAIAFIASVLGDRLAWVLSRQGIPEFYQLALAAMPASASGVILAVTGSGLQGSAVVTGGLFALLPGRALVAAVQDGLTGFYVTAAARLLEVTYLVTGIIIGVLAILPIGVYFAAELRPEETLGRSSLPAVQLPAAVALSFSFAVLLQCPRRALLLVAVNGGIAWTVFGTLTDQADLNPITATGIAAGLAGLFGQLAARNRRASSLPYVTAALGPLLPGSVIYRGVLAFIQGRAEAGLIEVSRAVAIALALAVGVNAGRELARLSQVLPTVGGRMRDAAKRTGGF